MVLAAARRFLAMGITLALTHTHATAFASDFEAEDYDEPIPLSEAFRAPGSVLSSQIAEKIQGLSLKDVLKNQLPRIDWTKSIVGEKAGISVREISPSLIEALIQIWNLELKSVFTDSSEESVQERQLLRARFLKEWVLPVVQSGILAIRKRGLGSEEFDFKMVELLEQIDSRTLELVGRTSVGLSREKDLPATDQEFHHLLGSLLSDIAKRSGRALGAQSYFIKMVRGWSWKDPSFAGSRLGNGHERRYKVKIPVEHLSSYLASVVREGNRSLGTKLLLDVDNLSILYNFGKLQFSADELIDLIRLERNLTSDGPNFGLEHFVNQRMPEILQSLGAHAPDSHSCSSVIQ